MTVAPISRPPDAPPAGRVTELDRIQWRIWADARAQDAFRRGRQATDRGQADDALRWLERAHRLAPSAANVTFPLAMARLSAGDPLGAARLLQGLLQRFDFREGWMALGAARRAAGSPDEAAAAVGGALARHAPDPAVRGFIDEIARGAGWPGWCGLSGDGRLHLDRSMVPAPVALRLDGIAIRSQGRRGAPQLPRGWRQARRLDVSRDGRALLGSPLDIQTILRVEGFVEAVDGRLTGWVWHPGEPERAPVITLRSASGSSLSVTMERFADRITSEMPLARPRLLCFPPEAAALEWDGVVQVSGDDGRDLLGSPLEPGLEGRAATAVALLQARDSTRGRLPPTGRKRASSTAVDLPPFLPVSASFVGRSPTVGAAMPVSVVVPVYRHLRRTLDCLESVLASVPAGTRLVVVEDASPDMALVRALVGLQEAGRIELLRHDANHGFPASANDGIAACHDHDVVLLNSDTLVAPGWLEALRRAAYAAPDIGTATPFTNDGSILSYPDRAARNAMPDLAGTRRLMELAAAANGDAVCDIPTGNGFCLYLRRDCLRQVGLLRQDLFAQGYGEENDFCLRARHLGWRHVAALGAYVAHVGNVSFGAARTDLMRRNLEVINRLHPGYDSLILSHIDADPLAAARRAIDLARWGQARRARTARDMAPRAALLITHDQGGGVERVVQERARQMRAQGLRPIVLRPDGDTVLVSDAALEETFPNLRFALPGEFEALVAMLVPDGVLHAEWHHLLGHHALLRTLCSRLAVPYNAYIHDYAWFCQRIALVGPGGRYCGEPDVGGCEACIAMQGSNLAEQISVPALLARSASELKAARRVVAPSQDAATRIARHFPKIRPEIVPWEDDRPDLSLERLAAIPPTPRPALERAGQRVRGGLQGRSTSSGWSGRPGRVAVIGGIGREKGYDVLLACLIETTTRSLPLEFVVVGHTPDDSALMEAGCRFVTGEYREDDALALIRSQEADLALLPSVWPETWCFTLGLAWRAGLAVAAFDLGAPAERIRRTGRGAVLPLGLPIPQLVMQLLRLCHSGA